MKGFSNEDAEALAVTILAQLFVKAIWIREDKDYPVEVFRKCMAAADEYVKDHTGTIALCRVINKREKEKEGKDD